MRALYFQKQEETTHAILEKESKFVIRKFNEVSNDINYKVQSQQRITALRRKEVQYRRSILFLYKDKRLKNAVPPQENEDGSAGPRFVSANPKLTKILQRSEQRRQDQELEE